MAMTKASVRDHVVAVCGMRRNAVQKEIEDLYKAELKPVVVARIKEIAGRIPEWATYIYDRLDANIEAIDALCKSDTRYSGRFSQNRAGEANVLSLLESKIMSQCWGNIKLLIENPGQGHHDFGSPEVNAIVDKLQKDEHLTDLLQRVADINALSKQLTTLIDKTAGSGKQAYERMVALGVDMSGYKEPEKQLPAVVYLSADVCLINGNC